MIAKQQASEQLAQTPPVDIAHSLGVKTKIADITLEHNPDTQSNLEAPGQTILSWEEFLASDLAQEVKDKAQQEVFSQFKKSHIELAHMSNGPVQVIIIKNSPEPINIAQKIDRHHHTLLIIPNNTQANISFSSSASDISFASSGLTILTGRDVHLGVLQVVKGDKKEAFLSSAQIFVGENSHVQWFATYNGSRLLGGIRGILDGAGANLIATTQMITSANQTHDINASIEHCAPKTTADLLCTGILKSSKIITRSLIKINQEAPQSKGFEKTKFLLLDESSRAVSIPDLEIHNDQVQCSHGATITTINQEELFYLQSKGIAQAQARELIIDGFVQSALERKPQAFQQQAVDEDE